jgi:CheY-like chemotaxis protein
MPRILVVASDTELMQVLEAALDSLGLEVETASSGADALAAAQARRPDALFVDFSSIGESGAAFAERVRLLEGYEQLPICLLGSEASAEAAEAARAIGCEVLPAPISLLGFRAVAQQLVRSSSSSR